MSSNVKSSLAAGAIALAIWLVMSLIFVDDTSSLPLTALLFFAGTFVVTLAISTVIARVIARRSRSSDR